MQEISHFNNEDWFLVTVLLVGACISLFASLRLFHRARLIEDMPTSKIRSCSQGYVELHGTTKWMEGSEIHAPLSGQPCVWFYFLVEEYAPHSKQKWRHIDSGVSEQFFLLEDDTGSCIVDPQDAVVTPSSSTTWYDSERNRPATHISPLELLGAAIFQSGQKYRYTERRLDQHESLYAIGEYRSMGSGYQQSLKAAAASYLRELKQDKEKLAGYDKNQDGEIDQQEWEEARKEAKRIAIEEQLSKPLPERMHILKKPETKKYQPFLLSSKSEMYMTRKNRIFSVVLAGLFIALSVGLFLKLANTY